MIDYTLYNINLFKPQREANIEFRWSQCNQSFEFVKWVQPQNKEKEYCFVIAFLDLDDKYEPTIRSVSDRIFDLSDDEMRVFAEIGKTVWDKYKNVRKGTLRDYISKLKQLN